MTEENLRKIQKTIGYTFKNVQLLQQAFIRESYIAQDREHQSNEGLKWIGESTLTLILKEKIASKYASVNALKELTFANSFEDCNKIVEQFMSDDFLSERIDAFELNSYLVMGMDDKKRKAQKKYSAKSGLLKAILGAVAIDTNYNMYTLNNVADLLLDIDYYLVNGFAAVNYLLLLQKWAMIGNYIKPHYEFNSNSFSYGSNFFQCTCFLRQVNRSFSAKGENKSAARMNVAKMAYDYLKENNLLFTLSDIIKDPTLDKAVNQLQELAFKEYISMPEYHLEELKDEEHDQIWKCVVYVDDASFEAVALTKRQSKKQAALLMLQHLMNSKNVLQ